MKRTYKPIPTFNVARGPDHVSPNACWARYDRADYNEGMWLDYAEWHRQFHGKGKKEEIAWKHFQGNLFS
jgi:hypothetical protein